MGRRWWLWVPVLVAAGACGGGATHTLVARRAALPAPTFIAGTLPAPTTTTALPTTPPPTTPPPTTTQPVPVVDCYSLVVDFVAVWQRDLGRNPSKQELSDLVHQYGRDDCLGAANSFTPPTTSIFPGGNQLNCNRIPRDLGCPP